MSRALLLLVLFGALAPAAGAQPTLQPAAPVWPAPATPTAPPASVGAPCNPVERLACNFGAPEESGWFQADYLGWFLKSGPGPVLAVADPAGTPRAAVGQPAAVGQRVLFGNRGTNGDYRSGLRIRGGVWLDEDRRWAVSGDFFFLQSGGDSGRFASSGNPPLSRPFSNVRTGLSDAELVSYPGVLAGSVAVSTRSSFSGGGAFLQRNLFERGGDAASYRLDALVGYRHLGFNDEIGVREDLLTTAAGLAPAGTRIVVQDRFRTRNAFDGGLVGLAASGRTGRWTADARVGVSLGTLSRELTVFGNTAVTPPGQPTSVRSGGLFAQRSNSGRFNSDAFTVAPEVSLNLGYQVTDNLSVYVGYSYFYLPNVWRAGDQIDRGIDPVQLQGVPSPLGRPAPRLASTDFWAQGVNVGFVVRY